MGKLIFQFLLLVGTFLGVWILLSQINFVEGDDVEKFARKNEKRLGTLILEAIKSTGGKETKSTELKAFIDSIGSRVCEKTEIKFDSVKVHIIRNSEVNAFALPDHHMVIYTGLIEDAKNPEEVAGVMAHEIAHMEKNHVMKKLGKEIGLSVLSMVGGDAGGEIIKQIAHTLSSSAFDRTQEQEADDFAVDAMAKTNIDPEHLANFLFRLSQQGDDMPAVLIWLSTHPDSKERASEILKRKKELKFDTIPVLKTPWKDVQELTGNSNDESDDE